MVPGILFILNYYTLPIMANKLDVLRGLYRSKTGSPGAFQGTQRLFKAARQVNNNIRYDDVIKFLKSEESHQLHFDDTQRKHRSISKRQWEVGQLGWIGLDTMYMAQGLGAPFPFLMIGVDLFSGKIFSSFLKKLDGKTGLNAAKRIFDQLEGYDLIGCCSDMGGEFSLIREYMREQKTKYYVAPAQSPNKISQCERAIRTIRTITGRILSSGETTSAMQAVKLAIASHNSTPSNEIGGLSPDQVVPEKQGEVLNVKLRQKLELESKMIDVPRLSVGQLVRIKEATSNFTKSNIPKYSKEVYKVEKVLPHSPTPGYVLRSTSTYAVLPGSFNYYQLQTI